MSVTLGAYVFPTQIDWADRYAYPAVQSQSRRTLAGRWHYSTRGLSGGRPITLEARVDACWFTAAEVQALQALAADPDTVYTLDWEGEETHQVIFDWERTNPVDLAEIAQGVGFWVGTVYLIGV